MKNTLFKLLLALGPKKKFQRKDAPRLLVVSTTGLGDSLWGTPAVKALRKKYPESHIALLTSPIGEQLFRNNPQLDEIFVVKNPALFSLLKLLPTLRKRAFDTAYIFHLSQRPVLPIISLAGPSKIIGTEGMNKGLDHLLTNPIKQTPLHEIERRLKIVGCENASAKMELFLTEEENNASFNHLVKAPLLIGMHPGAKDKFKQWNPKYFVELGRKLAKEHGATLFITGDNSEASLAEEIASHIPRAISIAGKLPVRVAAALIEKLDLFITNDTGPMHLSFAMETPTFALFSPTDPSLCGPYKINHGFVIQKPRTCNPCIRKKCVSPFCMEQISSSMAYEVIDAYLRA
ncbi:MAG: glycosyltransferase family 9 protein [Simkaniaceae bacterium]|jgi:ADP-heptose:LPS heptosyltransferase|nr:MAG: glycosyltransferase family 9 protein [Simkaniaceae bacterium]